MTKKHSLKIACLYTTTLLGAGFATGKELVSFFARFGKLGLVSFLFACFLFSICLISILDTIYNSSAKTYKEFMSNIFGKLGTYIEIFNIILIFILLSSMLAGGGATFSKIFNTSLNTSTIMFALLVFFTIIFGKETIVNINTIICPILIICGCIVGLFAIFDSKQVFSSYVSPIIASISYVSFNTVTTISVLFAIKNIIISRRVIFFSSVLGGFFIFCIGICILLPLTINFDFIKNETLPLIALIHNKLVEKIYTFTVILAIFTTAISNGFIISQIFKEKLNKNEVILKIFIISLAFYFSKIGFSNIVNFVYPFMGYLGIFEILVIVLSFLSNLSRK